MDDGVGDEFADDHHRVVDEPLGQRFGAGQAESGPFGEGGAYEATGGAGREGAAAERGVGDRAPVRTPARGRAGRTGRRAGHGLPLRRNGPHLQLPSSSDECTSVDADRVTD